MAPLRVLIVATTPRALANDRALLAADPEVVLVTDADDAEVTLLDLTEAVANELPAGAGDLGRTILLLACCCCCCLFLFLVLTLHYSYISNAFNS